MSAFEPFDLESWLEERSTAKQVIGNELVFSHKDGTTSVLVLRSANSPNDETLESSPMSWFYQKYCGASIGDSHVMLVASCVGGVKISHGFILPDRLMMGSTLLDLGVVGKDGDVFLGTEAAWMFAYAIRSNEGPEKLIRFDRDMQESEEVVSLESVLADWWQLVCEDEG